MRCSRGSVNWGTSSRPALKRSAPEKRPAADAGGVPATVTGRAKLELSTMAPPVGAGVVAGGEYSSRFGEPVPALVTTSVVAFAVSVAAIVAGVAPGCSESSTAAAPATCGEAIEVPLSDAAALSAVYQEEMMLWPGAKTSTHGPKLENEARASVWVLAPT